MPDDRFVPSDRRPDSLAQTQRDRVEGCAKLFQSEIRVSVFSLPIRCTFDSFRVSSRDS